MTTSGIVQSSLTISELMQEAFDYCQIAVEEEDLDPEDFQRGLRAANFMLRDWQAQGFHLWQYTEATLFLQPNRTLYNLKPVDDTGSTSIFGSEVVRCIRSDIIQYGFVSISAPVAPDTGKYFILLPLTYDCDGNAWATPLGEGQSLIGARVGVFSPTTKRIRWTQITEFEFWPFAAPTQTVIAPDDGQIWAYYRIDTVSGFSQIDDGDQIIIYQDGYQVDVERILDVRRANQFGTSSENETPVKFDSHQEFNRLPTKRSQGQPNVATFDRLVDGGCFNLWQGPQTANEFVMRLTIERTFQKFVNTGDTPDFPQYWQDAFIYNLAERLCIKFNVPPRTHEYIRLKAEETLNEALNYDNANYDMKVVINNRVGV